MFGICLNNPKMRQGMKKAALTLVAVLVAGCSEKVQVHPSTAEPKTVQLRLPTSRTMERLEAARPTPTRLGIPVYPGSVFVEGSEKLRIKEGETQLSRTYHSADPHEKVAGFYRSEAPRLGKLVGGPTGNELLSSWVVNASGLGVLSITVTRMKDGTTSLFLQTSVPNRE